MPSTISAMGGYVPPEVVNNARISEWTGKSPEWIMERTGILERRYAAPEVPTSELAFHAVRDLCSRYPGALDGVSMIILATSTPDRPQPPTAVRLQQRLGLSGIPAFDINAVCSGWLFGLRIADRITRTEPEKVLLVGADKYSGILNRSDPTTVTLFGDGAGAAIIEPTSNPRSGLRSILIASEGQYSDLVTVKAGGSEFPTATNPPDRLFQMQGREVKAYVLNRLPGLLRQACFKAGVCIEELGALICHQANVRLLEELARALGIHPSLLPLTAPKYGNAAAASVPLTLLEAQNAGLLVPGRPVALCSVGGGMSLAAAVYVP